ncbi:MAG: hypothetical protein KBG15_17480 [Kofleriaceae bacterium]|nr:hypothetical protein [Kofleriaceae bacterium]
MKNSLACCTTFHGFTRGANEGNHYRWRSRCGVFATTKVRHGGILRSRITAQSLALPRLRIAVARAMHQASSSAPVAGLMGCVWAARFRRAAATFPGAAEACSLSCEVYDVNRQAASLAARAVAAHRQPCGQDETTCAVARPYRPDRAVCARGSQLYAQVLALLPVLLDNTNVPLDNQLTAQAFACYQWLAARQATFAP